MKFAACLVAGLALGGAVTAAAAPNKIIFDSKSFHDSAQSGVPVDAWVYVAGTLSGEGVAYPNNSVSITCQKDREVCEVVEVQEIGPNQIGRIASPTIFPIVKWSKSEIVATDFLDYLHCRRVIISIDRKTQVASWIEQTDPQADPVDCRNAETKRYKWTIEDWRP